MATAKERSCLDQPFLKVEYMNVVQKRRIIHQRYFIDLEKYPALRKTPVNRVLLFTNARDEKNMKEWAAHHLLIGFSLIYIFDHKSKIPLKQVFHNFDNRVIVERCELDIAPKTPLMKKAANIAASLKADWFIYLDSDEFMNIGNYKNIKQLLNNYQFADSLAINWLYFGTNNHVKEPSGLIMENYTKSCSNIDRHVKTFVRPSQVLSVHNPHFYVIVNHHRMFSLDGRQVNVNLPAFHLWNIEFDKCPAYIAHYINQSEETYINRKILLPRDDFIAFRSQNKNIHREYNEVDNHSLSTKYVEQVKLFLSKKN